MSFSRSASEIQVSQASDASVTSLSVAEAGLDAFFSDTFSVRPQPGDSFRYNVVDGYAWVVPEELQRPADTVLNDVVYSIRSTGYLIEPTLGSTPVGVRTMVQFARWQVGSIQTLAVLTAANGINHRGSPPEYRIEGWHSGGNMNCSPTSGAQIPITRTTVAPPAPSNSTGLGPWIGGVASDSELVAQTGIDWPSIVAGKFQADYNSVQLGDVTGFTSQLINGNLLLTDGDRGSGLLIVTGDLTTLGGPAEVEWQGVVLVGGRLVADAALTDFHGLVFTGLNEVLGVNVPPNEVGGVGDVDFYYEPCLVDSMLTNLTGMVPVARSRVDNWATY